MTNIVRASVLRQLLDSKLLESSTTQRSQAGPLTALATKRYSVAPVQDFVTSSSPKISVGYGARARSLVRALLSWRI